MVIGSPNRRVCRPYDTDVKYRIVDNNILYYDDIKIKTFGCYCDYGRYTTVVILL